jgi:hypothetical protein
MDPIVVVAIIVGIIVALFVLDWRLNRNRARPGREAPPSAAEVDHEQHPHAGVPLRRVRAVEGVGRRSAAARRPSGNRLTLATRAGRSSHDRAGSGTPWKPGDQ